jgi:CRP/FNR family cyclic AMP-dependent transcriptional regulator
MARGTSKDYLNDLAKVPLFSQCSRDELETIATLGTEVEVEAGRVLMEQGDAAREAFLVREGEAVCEKDGDEVARFGPGDFFGEMALISHGPRTATVTAATPMTLRAFHVTEFNQLLHDTPSIAVKILLATAERLLHAEQAPTH